MAFIINSPQNMQDYMMTITKKLLRFKCYKRILNKWQKITQLQEKNYKGQLNNYRKRKETTYQ